MLIFLLILEVRADFSQSFCTLSTGVSSNVAKFLDVSLRWQEGMLLNVIHCIDCHLQQVLQPKLSAIGA